MEEEELGSESEDESDTGQSPPERWVLGLELSREDVGLASGLVHVDRALIDALFFLAFDEQHRLAVHDWHDRELFLGLGLFETPRSIPPGALDLEAEDVGTIFTSCKHLGDFRVPVESLLDVGLDVELVKTLASLLSAHLLDSGKE